MKFAFYGCHDDNTPFSRGDLFRFAGCMDCADGAEAKEKAKVALPLGFVGYVVIVANGMTPDFNDLLVSGVHVDNRRL
jgi:hypothetical protein